MSSATIAPVLLLVDLDGVVYRARHPIPGVASLLARRVAAGDAVVYVTNNSMFHRRDYVQRLAELGAPVDAERVVSSARATALFLVRQMPSVRRVLAVGAEGLMDELRDVGLQVVSSGEVALPFDFPDGAAWEAAGRPEAVVVGLDPTFTYGRLAVASDCVRAGARLVATNRDPIYPSSGGLRPGAGSIVAAVEAASGSAPLVIGKPEPHLLEMAAAAVGMAARAAVVVGDGLRTDVAAARAVGARSVLMLTGVTRPEDLALLPPGSGPDAVARDAGELEAILETMGPPDPAALR